MPEGDGRGTRRMVNVLHAGSDNYDSGFRVQIPGFRVQGARFRIAGSGLRVAGCVFCVPG